MPELNFEELPHPALLQQLARGALVQSQNLLFALRLWAILRWLYSQEGYKALTDRFTLTSWRESFFSTTHPKSEQQQEILEHSDRQCACHHTTKDWLSKWGCNIAEWQQSLAAINVARADLDEILAARLFALTRKSLQTYFDRLVNLNYLQLEPSAARKSKPYCRKAILPEVDTSANLSLASDFTPTDRVYLAQTVDMLSFLNPQLSAIAEQISPQVSATRRIFLHVDYIVPPATQDRVDDIQEDLQQIWRNAKLEKKHVTPVLVTYHSAHLNQIKQCVVYPTCIYYVQRAKYLCAYGSNPNGEIDWYNYRLDRIVPESLIKLSWQDPRVPALLLNRYKNDRLPHPEEIQIEMENAWGFDFYNKSSLMLVRFERDFHDRYIDGTFRHYTFEQVNYNTAKALLQKEIQQLEQKQSLLKILHSCSPTDIYYKAKYRIDDNNVIMRLRAWGPKMEVLLPGSLRQRMIDDVQDTYNLYRD